MTAQALKFVPFEMAHLSEIAKTHPTQEMLPTNIIYAETALRSGRIIYSAGLSEVGPQRLIAWGRIADIRPRELLIVADRMRETIDEAKSMGNHVTAAADVSKAAWLKRLGFKSIRAVLVAT